MNRIRRLAAATLVTAALAAATTTVAAGPAAASTQTGAGMVYCRYDDRETPPTISYGARSDTVKEAQCLLQFKGFNIGSSGVDGHFGSSTRSAVRAAQAEYGLAVDGIGGPGPGTGCASKPSGSTTRSWSE
jgi:peptidoglycan hydrolase-like protein with peptidoglycan-binding domain